MTEHRIEVGSFDRVVIEKMFGPTVYCDLRITAKGADGFWIIEREKIIKDGNGSYISTGWEKILEFDAQESIFEDSEVSL